MEQTCCCQEIMLNYFKLQLAIIFVWVLLFVSNGAFNSFLYDHPYIFIIFLPAGFKITIACFFGKRIFIGLFFGSLITALVFLDGALKVYFDNSAVVYALISAGSPIFTMLLINKVMPLGEHLENLNIEKVLIISLVYSIINTLMHNTYSFLSGDIALEKYQMDSILMFSGDFLGCLLFLFIVSYFRKGIFVFTNKWF